MIKKNNQDILEIFSNFQKTLEKKPSAGQMFDEVRMMKFKIRPIMGDISFLQLKDNGLIETLWSLGKLDEMFQKEYKKLRKTEQEIFFRMFENLYHQFQSQLANINLSRDRSLDAPRILEMEIFKEMPSKKKSN